MSAAMVILYLLSGEGSLTPLAQFADKDSCTKTIAILEATLSGSAVQEMKFACVAPDTIMEMLDKNGVKL